MLESRNVADHRCTRLSMPVCAEDSETHTFAGLTLIKPQKWQTIGAHFFGQKQHQRVHRSWLLIASFVAHPLIDVLCVLSVSGGLMWFWLIYRFKNDYKVFLVSRAALCSRIIHASTDRQLTVRITVSHVLLVQMLEHPWDAHGDHAEHGDGHGHGHDDAHHEDAHGEEKEHH